MKSPIFGLAVKRARVHPSELTYGQYRANFLARAPARPARMVRLFVSPTGNCGNCNTENNHCFWPISPPPYKISKFWMQSWKEHIWLHQIPRDQNSSTSGWGHRGLIISILLAFPTYRLAPEVTLITERVNVETIPRRNLQSPSHPSPPPPPPPLSDAICHGSRSQQKQTSIKSAIK